MISELISVLGYQRAQPGEQQSHTRLVARRIGRTWVVRCSAKTDKAGLPLPENEQSIRSSELFALGFGALLQDARAKFQRATNVLRAKLCRSSTDGFHRGR